MLGDRVASIIFVTLLSIPFQCFGAEGPKLSISLDPAAQLRLSWTSSAPAFQLEESTALGPISSWHVVSTTPAENNDVYALTLSAGDQTRFYRLRSGLQVTSISEISPRTGETGVSVARETVLRFSGPLSSETVLDNNNFYAEFGGRRLLTRAELSSDLRTATLFYLENLPGSGQITVTLDGNGISDATGTPLDADGDGGPGGVLRTTFVTSSTSGLANTGVIGHVYASAQAQSSSGTLENVPLAGVTITVDGAEETLRATTDTNGLFTLRPAPSGSFFVHIDGRTAVGSHWPRGEYYPFVGKQWQAKAGVTNNLAGGTGEIFLPLIPADALQPVNVTTPTEIQFSPSILATNPALAGVQVTVPGGALFSENGDRGGKVGIAPVPPDRLPGPLPPGLNLPLVITIQTDGPQNFDQPAPVKFPNLPDPVTGVKLPPGAKTALWSFNHDTGRWEVQGSATVTADGLFAVTDPGVGVRQPGWHGVAPGSPASGPTGGGTGGGNNNNCNPPEGVLWDCDHDGCPDSTEPCKTDCNDIRDMLNNRAKDCYLSDFVFDELRSFFCGYWITCPRNGFKDAFHQCRQDVVDLQFQLDQCLINSGGALPSIKTAFHAQSTDPLAEQGQLDLLTDAAYQALLGSAAWTSVPASDTGVALNLIGALSDATDPSSPGGKMITTAEQTAITALPLPANITSTLVQTAIARLNAFVDGSLPAADRQSILDKMAARDAFWNSLQTSGWKTDLDGYFQSEASSSTLLARSTFARETFLPRLGYFYVVENLENGFVLRGQLNDQGSFDNLVLAPDSWMKVAYYDPHSGALGSAIFHSQRAGQSTIIPAAPMFFSPNLTDTDGDGLPDTAEFIVGTDPANPDTDGDGLSDRLELANNLNPLDGVESGPGLVSNVASGGTAQDICLTGNLACIANSASGAAIFDVSKPLTPIKLTQLPTATSGNALAAEGSTLAIAEAAGISVWDLAQPASPLMRYRQALTEAPRSIRVAGGLVFCGSQKGTLFVLDSLTGETLYSLSLTKTYSVEDLSVSLPWIYAFLSGSNHLHVVQLTESNLTEKAALDFSATTGAGGRRLRLQAGDNLLYAVSTRGFTVLNTGAPELPAILQTHDTAQLGWRQLVPTFENGALAAVGNNSVDSGPHDVTAYDLSPGGTNLTFLATFPTAASGASSLAVHGNFAFVADSLQGLSVLRHSAPDPATNPPAVAIIARTLTSSPPAHTHDSPLAVLPKFGNSTHIDHVEYYVDGALASVALSPPFDSHVRTPILTATKQAFTLQALAFDTAGRFGSSELLTINLLPDHHAPKLTAFTPANGSRFLTNSLIDVTAIFSRPLDPSTLSGAFTLTESGPDKMPGTGDDIAVPVSVSASGLSKYRLSFAQPLPPGDYTVRASSTLADPFGNKFGTNQLWTFFIRRSTELLPVSPTNIVWNSSAATNWSTGVVPTTNDFVILDLPGINPQIQPQGNVFAGELTSRESFLLSNNASLTIASVADFQAPLAMVGQCFMRQGTVLIEDSFSISGQGNSFLDGVIVTNFGHVTLASGVSSGLLLTRGAQLHNLAGSVVEMQSGSLVQSISFGFTATDQPFDNAGLFLKTGTNDGYAFLDFRNTGRMEIREGQMQILDRLQNFGEVEVKPGASLSLQSASLSLPYLDSPAARIYGGGKVSLSLLQITADSAIHSAYEVSGATEVLKEHHFRGDVRSPGTWSIQGGPVIFSGLVTDLGPVTNTSTIEFAGTGEARIESLSQPASGGIQLDSGASLRVDGALSQSGNAHISVIIGPNSATDARIIAGQANLGGILGVAAAFNFTPDLDKEYLILSSPQLVGQFTTLQLPQLPNNRKFQPIWDATSLKVRVVKGP